MPPTPRPKVRQRLLFVLFVVLAILALGTNFHAHQLLAQEPATPFASTIPPLATEPPALYVPVPTPMLATPYPTATSVLPAAARDVALDRVVISEILPSPWAVEAVRGEWIELHNEGDTPVDLRDWAIWHADGVIVIDKQAILPADGYFLLGREANPLLNGGVAVQLQYTGLQMGKSGWITLLRPDGGMADTVTWGNTVAVVAGRSFERMDSSQPEAWRLAWRAWQGSAGDWGSPGATNVPPPTPVPSLTASATPQNPAGTATPTASPLPLPAAWQWREQAGPLWFDEVYYRGDDEEYVVLANRGDTPVDLAGWMLADATIPGANEGVLLLPSVMLSPGGLYVVARNGTVFTAQWGHLPDAQIDRSDAPVTQLLTDRRLGTGRFSLADRGDTLLLLDPEGKIVDALSFGAAGDADDVIQLNPRISAATGNALQRMPHATQAGEGDQRYFWMSGAPSPFAVVTLPAPATSHSAPALVDDYYAWWGVLGARSNFSTDGSAFPPQYVVQDVAAMGLDFLALGDGINHQLLDVPDGLALLPAWRWQGSDGEEALLLDFLYGDFAGGIPDRWAMLSWLIRRHPVTVWLDGAPPEIPEVAAAQVNATTLEQLRTRTLALWRSRGAPLLPVAPMATLHADTAWRVGLAAQSNRADALLDAVHHARGWLTTSSALHLVLSAETESGRVWMGDRVDPANSLRLRIDAGEHNLPLAVRLWQDNTLLFAGEVNGTAYVEVIAAPGAWLYLTTAEGEAMGISAPLLVRAPREEKIVITEVLADPDSDWNGDGSIDDGDEFVEFYNAGDQPVSLDGWILQDKIEAYNGRGQLRFGAQHVIPAGAYYLLWRGDGGPVINANSEGIYLRTPGYGMADEVNWSETMPSDRTLARIGSTWYWGALPSPGRATEWIDGMTVHTPPVYTEPDVEEATANSVAMLAEQSSAGIGAAEITTRDAASEVALSQVTLTGAVQSVEGTALWLVDLARPASAALVVRMPIDSLGHPPAALPGEVWRVTGALAQDGEGTILIADAMERILLK